MQSQTKFCLSFTKVDTKFFSAPPMLSLITLVGPSPNKRKFVFFIIGMRR